VLHLFKTEGKISQGGLLIFHGLIFTNESNFIAYMNDVYPIICDAIVSNEDATVGRIACGLVSDLCNYLEKGMTRYAEEFMKRLRHVLKGNEYESETKVHAIIAIGDICLAIQEDFAVFIDDSMVCLQSASKVTLAPPNFENNELLTKLRDAILDAFMSILHGFHDVC